VARRDALVKGRCVAPHGPRGEGPLVARGAPGLEAHGAVAGMVHGGAVTGREDGGVGRPQVGIHLDAVGAGEPRRLGQPRVGRDADGGDDQAGREIGSKQRWSRVPATAV
jgi:hypothetical protein